VFSARIFAHERVCSQTSPWQSCDACKIATLLLAGYTGKSAMISLACDKSAHAASFLFDSEGALTIFRDPSPGKPNPHAGLQGSNERKDPVGTACGKLEFPQAFLTHKVWKSWPETRPLHLSSTCGQPVRDPKEERLARPCIRKRSSSLKKKGNVPLTENEFPYTMGLASEVSPAKAGKPSERSLHIRQ
jgi:hypothetical protein